MKGHTLKSTWILFIISCTVIAGCNDDQQTSPDHNCKLTMQSFESNGYHSTIFYNYKDDGTLASHVDDANKDTPLVEYVYENGKLLQLKTDSWRTELEYLDGMDIPLNITNVYSGKSQDKTTITTENGKIIRIECWVPYIDEKLRLAEGAEFSYNHEGALSKINILHPDRNGILRVSYQYKDIVMDGKENPFVNDVGFLIYCIHMRNYLFLGNANVVSATGTGGINSNNREYINHIKYNDYSYPIQFNIQQGIDVSYEYKMDYSCK